MGCNCGKKKTQPTGASAKAAAAAADKKTTAASKRTQSFTLQTRDGRTETFGSYLEADAARVRAGGGHIL